MKQVLLKTIRVIVLLGITSCSSMIKEVYKVNQNHNFESLSNYADFFEKSNNISGDNLLYLDSTSHKRFLDEVVKQKLATYYGSFINDTIEVKKSDFLQENMGCMSRVLNEIKNSTTRDFFLQNDSLFIKNENFTKNVFIYLKSNKQFQFNKTSKKLTVFLLYSTQLGELFKKDFQILQKYAIDNKNDVKLYIISIDKCYNLK